MSEGELKLIITVGGGQIKLDCNVDASVFNAHELLMHLIDHVEDNTFRDNLVEGFVAVFGGGINDPENVKRFEAMRKEVKKSRAMKKTLVANDNNNKLLN